MERVIYYLMLLFGFLIMQRVYKWRVENGLNKSKELGNEDKEDKGRKEPVKDVSLLVGFGGLSYVEHYGGDLFNDDNAFRLFSVNSFFDRGKPSYYGKKVLKLEDFGLERSLEDYNKDLFNILSGDFYYKRFFLKRRGYVSVEFFSDDKKMNSDLYDYNKGKSFIYLSYSYSLGLLIRFFKGFSEGGDFDVFPLNRLVLDYSLEKNEVYFFDIGNTRNYYPEKYMCLATHSNEDTLNLFKFFDFFVGKLKEAK